MTRSLLRLAVAGAFVASAFAVAAPAQAGEKCLGTFVCVPVPDAEVTPICWYDPTLPPICVTA